MEQQVDLPKEPLNNDNGPASDQIMVDPEDIRMSKSGPVPKAENQDEEQKFGGTSSLELNEV